MKSHEVKYNLFGLSVIGHSLLCKGDDRKEKFFDIPRKTKEVHFIESFSLKFLKKLLHCLPGISMLTKKKKKTFLRTISRSIPQKLLARTLWFRYLTAEKSLAIKALIWSLRVEFGSCYLRRWSAESSFCRSESVYNRSKRVINITVTSQRVRCKITEMKSINYRSILVKSID